LIRITNGGWRYLKTPIAQMLLLAAAYFSQDIIPNPGAFNFVSFGE